MNAFNVKSQTVEPHVVVFDKNGEYLFTAEDGTFFKLPGSLDKEGVLQSLEAHEASNKGQVTVEQVQEQEGINQKRLQDLIQ